MKTKILKWLIAFLVIAATVFFIILAVTPSEPYYLVGDLIEAGIEFSQNPVDAELLKYRKIVVTADINAVAAQKIIKGLLLLDAIDSTAPIDLYILTDGGWMGEAFGVIDVIKSIKAPVNTHALGGTNSAGAMILAAGTGVRYGYPNSSIMFHAGMEQDEIEEYGEDKIDNIRLIQFWETNSQMPAEWINMKEDETYYLTSDEALEFGIIDEIKEGK